MELRFQERGTAAALCCHDTSQAAAVPAAESEKSADQNDRLPGAVQHTDSPGRHTAAADSAERRFYGALGLDVPGAAA